MPWKPVREKKQEWRPNWEEKKIVFANTKVLKKIRPCSSTRNDAMLHTPQISTAQAQNLPQTSSSNKWGQAQRIFCLDPSPCNMNILLAGIVQVQTYAQV